MKERRDFLKGSLALAAGIAVVPASESFAATGSTQSGIVYTKKDPGQWSAQVKSHAPVVTRDGKKIRVITEHPMTEIHYIVRHTLVAENGTVIGAITFAPEDEKAVSSYILPDNAGSRIYATSFCNQHDFWLSEFVL